MNKYEKIIDLFTELLDELNKLSKREMKILALGIESSILTDRINELRKEEANETN